MIQTNSLIPNDSYFMIIDGHALIYRAYHAFPPTLMSRDGKLVNAVYGFSRILLTVINNFNPIYMCVAFDTGKPNFRHEIYQEYKAHRPPMPDDLISQLELIQEVTEAFNIPKFMIDGFEADDIIGTLCQKVGLDNRKKKEQLLTLVVTGDKDTLQLVDEDTFVWLPSRGKKDGLRYGVQEVRDKLGVYPRQIVDYKALMGDSSDNIPGIRGIGKKTAAALLQEFDNLDNIYQYVDNNPLDKAVEEKKSIKKSIYNKLINNKQQAYLSRKLARICLDAPIKLDLDICRTVSYDKKKVTNLFEQLDFNSLLNKLPPDEFEQGIQDALF